MNVARWLLAAAAVASSVVPIRAQTAGDLFVDRAAETGLDFVHFNGMTGEHYLLEVNGSGSALFDYDNDGDLDAYLVQGHLAGPGKTMADALFPQPAGSGGDRLYRNDLVIAADGSRRLRFVDVTEASGIHAEAYGMGVAAADYDNDGWIDLYITNFGSNLLLRNGGDGTFADVTAASGADDVRWSVPAAFLDYDGDGWLDLFVGNYVDFSFSRHRECASPSGAPDYCAPIAYESEPDRLLRNRGDGTFEDVTRRAGIQSEFGNALGSVTADFNDDGLVDVYVANDMVPNQMWINQGEGTFRNDALVAGSAVNEEGRPEASMGVVAGDVDGDGDEDLFMTHLAGETNTLYLNDGAGIFFDETRRSGLGEASWNKTAFGTVWLDIDNDGLLDLIVANGAVSVLESLARLNDPYPLHQTNQMFRNIDGSRFEEITDRAGRVFGLSEVSRGIAMGDVDNDGDTDVLISNNAGPARLLINEAPKVGGWIGLRALTGSGPRDAFGARLHVGRDGKPSIWRRVRVDGSYASSSDPRVLVGLGTEDPTVHLEIRWPDGRQKRLLALPTGRYAVVRQLSGGTQ